jgi:hypothetical protein
MGRRLFGSVASLSGDVADPLDVLLTTVLRDEPLLVSPVGSSGGACDVWSAGGVSRRDQRRLVAAGLVSARCGVSAEELAGPFADRVPAGLVGDADGVEAWVLGEMLRGLDLRAEVRRGDVVVWHEQERPLPEDDDPCFDEEGNLVPSPADVAEVDSWRVGEVVGVVVPTPAGGDVPGWVVEWLGRLVYGPKRELLAGLVAWRWHGGARPVIPVAPWAVKLAERFDRKCGAR